MGLANVEAGRDGWSTSEPHIETRFAARWGADVARQIVAAFTAHFGTPAEGQVRMLRFRKGDGGGLAVDVVEIPLN